MGSDIVDWLIKALAVALTIWCAFKIIASSMGSNVTRARPTSQGSGS